MPQANGNASPERVVEPQPQRQSAVQIAIKNFSPVWYVPAFLICVSVEHSTLAVLSLGPRFASAQLHRKARCNVTAVRGEALAMLDNAS